MAILHRKERVSDEIPTASMADIAFLLLVFFLTTTVFNEEKGLPIVLPEESEEQDVSAKNIIFFIVRPDGAVVVRRGESEQEQVVAFNQIENILRTELAANENLIAAIKTDPAAPYKHMINVLDEVKLAGADRISLQMLEE
ncbi:MAG: biopolymer transporter ExbD [Gemmatimonadales bacterium]|nr:MAG: biopolymer transporter ExbD [Gemmatimonadales bacterium]